MPRSILEPDTGGPLWAVFRLLRQWPSGQTSQPLNLPHPLDRLLLPADVDELEVMKASEVSHRPIAFVILELQNSTRALGDPAHEGLLQRWGGLGCHPKSFEEIATEDGVPGSAIKRRIERSLNRLGELERVRLGPQLRSGQAGQTPGAPQSLEVLFASAGFVWLLGQVRGGGPRGQWRVLQEVAETVLRSMRDSAHPDIAGVRLLAERAVEERRRIGIGTGRDESLRRYRIARSAYPLLALGAESMALEGVRVQRRQTAAHIEAVAYGSTKRLFRHANMVLPADYLARLPDTSRELLGLRNPHDELLGQVARGALIRLASADAWAEEMIIDSYVARFQIQDMPTLAVYNRYVIGRARRSSGKQRIRGAVLAASRLGPLFAPELEILNRYDLAVLVSSHEEYQAAGRHLAQAERLVQDPRASLTPARRAGLVSIVAHGTTMLFMRQARQRADLAMRTGSALHLGWARRSLNQAVEAARRQAEAAQNNRLERSDKQRALVALDRRIREIEDAAFRLEAAAASPTLDHESRSEALAGGRCCRDALDGLLRQTGCRGAALAVADPVLKALHYLAEADAASRWGNVDAVRQAVSKAQPFVIASAGITHLAIRLDKQRRWLDPETNQEPTFVVPDFVTDQPLLPSRLEPTWRVKSPA